MGKDGESMKHVEGRHLGAVRLYALSTCGWCRKTKNLLNELGVSYDYLDMDLAEGPEREKALEEIRKWNPSISFPTIILDDRKCIVGFKEEELREELAA